LYEYAVISRSYGLGLLLVFTVCALYKKRSSNYILLGIILALLANVTIFSLIISLGIGGILLLDYFFYQKKNKKITLPLVAGVLIFIVGAIFSLYQIWPDKNNSFNPDFATKVFDFPRWAMMASKLFYTYFYIPEINEINFWNTNIYVNNTITVDEPTFWQWLVVNPAYLWACIYMPCILFILGVAVFIRKPLILLLYSGVTLGLISVYYYTGLVHMRYCGHLLVTLIICYWLAEYYSEKKYGNLILRFFSSLGKKISELFLVIVLIFNLIAAIVAYTMDYQYKFSSGKDAADYIKENKLDTLPIAGITDFTQSPIATYLDTKIYYLQMNDFGSFTIWNKKRKNQMTFQQMVHSIDSFMRQGRTKILLLKDSAPQVSKDGKNFMPLERGMIAKDLQLDLLKTFEAGIVSDERYYIYMVQKVDSSKVDFNKYPVIN
ncbi:MAG: hypothetical protein M3O67_01010, partial [Bacteroidota bacterium]|nr:hypothetical protein [Bacteroidota bacterium]